jgi:hypothetical protein
MWKISEYIVACGEMRGGLPDLADPRSRGLHPFVKLFKQWPVTHLSSLTIVLLPFRTNRQTYIIYAIAFALHQSTSTLRRRKTVTRRIRLAYGGLSDQGSNKYWSV